VSKDSTKRKSATKTKRPGTDWARVDASTDEEIEAAVRDDPDAPPIVDAEWFASATLVMPEPKEQIRIRLDRDVLEHFRRYPRYQTRINAILRAVMEHEKKAG
jgi:uncharacterized protein (DUF4415 family)